MTTTVLERVRAVDKVGRNQVCPCGSGRKAKRCCLAAGPSQFVSSVGPVPAAKRRGPSVVPSASEYSIAGDSFTCYTCGDAPESLTDYEKVRGCNPTETVALLQLEHGLLHGKVDARKLGIGHLRELRAVSDPVQQRRLAARAVSKHLSVVQLRQETTKLAAKEEERKRQTLVAATPPPKLVVVPQVSIEKLSGAKKPRVGLRCKKTIAPEFKYFYLTAQHTADFMAEGTIPLGPCDDPLPTAMFSARTDWDGCRSQFLDCGNFALHLSHEGAELLGRGLVRIRVAPETAPVNWLTWKSASGAPLRLVRDMERIAKKCKVGPWSWWFSYEAVPVSKWLGIEAWTGTRWEEVKDVENYLATALAKPQPSIEELEPFILEVIPMEALAS